MKGKGLPDFLIVGAQKSGTSALHALLDRHPNLKGSYPKELNYFNTPVEERISKEEYMKYFSKSRFTKTLTFESTPSYMFYPGSIEEIKSLCPDAKIIICLRDPVERAYSAWNMYKRKYNSNELDVLTKHFYGRQLYEFFNKFDRFPSFQECCEKEVEIIDETTNFEPSIVRRGLYFEQIKTIFNVFGKNKVYIVGANELKNNTLEVLQEIAEFLQIDSFESVESKEYHVGKYDSEISEEFKSRLEEFYKADSEKLFSLLGRDLNW